jgi:hypothetical protein
VWILVAAAAVAAFVTYSRLPTAELYNVSRSGVRGGASRVLVDLNFPDALIALAVLGVIAPFLSRRLRAVAAVAAVLSLVVVVPGVVRQSDLDARWINVVPALGVLLAFALTPFAKLPRARCPRGDRVRVALAVLFVLLASPWIAAELGFYLDGVPVLGSAFQTGKDRLVSRQCAASGRPRSRRASSRRRHGRGSPSCSRRRSAGRSGFVSGAGEARRSPAHTSPSARAAPVPLRACPQP